jgi:hypothetical protein
MQFHEQRCRPGMPGDLRKRIREAAQWLSGPQVFQSHGQGGPAGFVDWVAPAGSGGRGYLYPEITGYAVSTLEWVIRTGAAAGWEPNASRDAVTYLIETACDSSGAVVGCARSRAARFRYTFDTGMVLKGLCAYYQRTRDPRVLATMKRCAGYVESQISLDGLVTPWQPLEHSEIPKQGWSSRAGPHHSKTVLALACFCRLTGASEARHRLEPALEWTLGCQDNVGFFALPGRPVIHMHCHLYACEGLFLLGCLRGDRRLRASACRGIEAALAVYDHYGRLPASLGQGLPTHAERSDIVAQLLRLCLLTGTGRLSQREALAKQLASYQIETARGYGGLRFGYDLDPDSGQVIVCMGDINTWSTLFAVQAWAGLAVPAWAGLWVEEPWLFA